MNRIFFLLAIFFIIFFIAAADPFVDGSPEGCFSLPLHPASCPCILFLLPTPVLAIIFRPLSISDDHTHKEEHYGLRIPENLRLMRDTARRFVKNELEPISQQVEKRKKVPESVVQKMREMGFFGLSIPKNTGDGVERWRMRHE